MRIRLIILAILGFIFVFLINSWLAHPQLNSSLSHQRNQEYYESTQVAVVDPDTTEKQLSTTYFLHNSNISTTKLLAQTQENQTSFQFLEGIPVMYLGIIGSLLAGLTTGIGGLPVLFVSDVSERIQGVLLGFAAGVMLAATSFSLLVPSIEAASEQNSKVAAAAIVVVGTLLGGVFLWATHRYFPYERYIKKPKGSDFENLKGIWLFVLAIAIHNFPEGLAVGVGFGGGDMGNGIALAVGIGLQNLPEGLAVALALITENYSRTSAFWVALSTGLLEPVGGLFGASIISLGQAFLPWGMSFAAGAMLFVISDHIIPESQKVGRGKEVTAGVMVGFVIMMFLDVTLG